MAAALPMLLGGLLLNKTVSKVGKALFGKKKEQAVSTQRPGTVNAARIAAEERDRTASRTGTGANRRVGFGAGEAATGPKTSLLGRSGG